MPRRIDMVEQICGRLTVLSFVGLTKQGQARWLCICECGTLATIPGADLRNGHTKSCGCLQKEVASLNRKGKPSTNYKHGRTGDELYMTWAGMKQRCSNSNDPRYDSYGGRGIAVCKRWDSFENFFKDMGERPNGKSLDRINNDGNYEPSNCRWATLKEQLNNTRKTLWITINGVTKALIEWADMYNISGSVLRSRLRLGWPIERALREKIKTRN